MSESRPLHIVVLEDDEGHLDLIERSLRLAKSTKNLRIFDTIRSAALHLETSSCDMVITDYLLPDGSGLELLDRFARALPIPFVVMTSHGDEKLAVKAIKAGAFDYMVKSAESLIDMDHFIDRTMREWKTQRDLKFTKAALRESEAKFESIVRGVPDIIYRLDSKGRFTFVSSAIEKLGYQVEELLGRSVFDLIHPADRDKASFHANERRTGERRTRAFELRLMKKNKKALNFEVHAYEYFDPLFLLEAEGLYDEGKAQTEFFAGTQGIARDITQRRQAEIALRESEERFRATFEHAAVGMAHITKNGRILRANSKLAQILKLNHDALLRASLLDFTHPDEFQYWLTKLEDLNAIRIGEHGAEKHFQRANGEAFWGMLTLAPVFEGPGPPKYFIAVLEDSTVRRSLEEELNQAMKLDSLGRLAGGIAHDFNNILTVIRGYCDLANAQLEDDKIRLVSPIQEACDRAIHLTQQLLAFSRKQVLQPVVLDLNQVLERLQNLLKRLIREDIQLIMNLDPQIGPIKADLTQMEQVIINLVVNARDAMPRGGTITLQSVAGIHWPLEGLPKAKDWHADEFVVLEVVDTGSGIDPAILDRLFEPFFTTKEKGKGTGLGLATSHGIIQQSGGFIQVKSALGKGSRFQVFLPTSSEPLNQAARVEPPILHYKGNGRSILVVEDQNELRELIREVLSRQGFDVVIAENGEIALDTMKTQAFDLVLSDLVMPRVNGIQLYHALRDRWPEVKVAFMSGYTEDTHFLNLLEQEGVPFMSKPFTTASLINLLRNAFEPVA
ncbi:MAG: response regulator [Acidobacteria bacterium]|nr:response regulator [Acidobacteriota bacterium]